MAVKTSCEEQKQDVIIVATVQGDYVTITAKSLKGGSWSIGNFRQDTEGALFFERYGSISSLPACPKVALEPGTTKIKVI